jgi:hypothetical protein
MSEMEKTKRAIISVLNLSRLGEIEKVKLLNGIVTDINDGLEDVKSGGIKMTRYWFVCYQIGGCWSVENVVLKDEHPIRYIIRKNDGGPKVYRLVNFWEIDQKQYDELSKYIHFLDI